jgi:PRC-barrel domain
MTRTNKPIRFLTTSAIVLALAAPAFAQSDTGQAEQPPAAMEQGTDQLQAPESYQSENGTTGTGTTMESDAPTLKNTLTDKPVDPLKKTRSAAADDLPTEPILTEQKPSQMVSDEIIGMDVRNPENESIGTIDALVVDKRNRVVAGIVSVGGFLGIGAKEVAVNWKQFKFQPEEDVAVVSLSRVQLEEAPAFRETDEVQAQLEMENQRREVKKQQDRFEDQAEPPVDEAPASE